MKYKLVIFDFDGTLADTLPWYLNVADSVADTFRFRRVAAHEFETLRGYSARQVIKHLGIPLWKIPQIARHMHALTARDIDQIRLFEGITSTLHQLSAAGVTLALVTSNSYANAQQVLGPTNSALFAYFECGTSVFGKRHRFRKVLRQSGVQPHEALSIGDEIRDLEAAQRERIPFGAVAWGFTNIESFRTHNPAEVFMRVDEIVEAVL